MINALNHLTISIGQAHFASKSNKAKGLGTVVLAKANDGTSIVIEAVYANRRERHFRYGYTRFGLRPIWVGTYTLPVCPLSLKCDDGTTLDERICRDVVDKATDAANRTELARKNAA
jgi:hypothetical protein